MGLLDFSGFVGDDTAKDEFGMTQADRRQPLFTGLLKAGMLGMAAGENITPGQRAQLMGQVGGAIGDIPEAMNRNRAEAAQMQLRRQQFQTGQQKLEQATKLRAYAQTPEFAAMIKDMPEFQKAGLKFLIESGDADAVQRLLSSYQTAQTAQAETQRKEKRDDAKEAAKAAADAAKEAGFGNTPYGINARNLRDAPIDSYAYWLAHQFFMTEQKDAAGNILPKMPGLENLTPPEWKPGMPPAGTPGKRNVGPTVDPNAPKPPEVDPNAPKPAPTPTPGAVETWTDGDRTYNAFPDDRVEVRDKNGNLITTEPPKEIPPAEQAKMIEATALRAGINDSAQKFLARWKAASPLERAAALANKSHPLNAAWVNTMLQAKGEALYQLGVLNKGDLPQLQKALADPNTPMSAIFSSTEDVELQVNDMLSVMDARRKSKEDSYKEKRRRRPPQAAAAAGSGGGGGGGGGAPKPPRKNEKGEYVVD